MGIFDSIVTDGLEETGDRVGGFQTLDSDVYDATIAMAYIGNSQSSKATSVNMLIQAGGQEFRQTFWVLNKEGLNYRVDGKKKIPLSDYVTVDEICLLATHKGLNEQDIEEKVIKIYSFESKKEEPTPAQVITSLIGKPIRLGIQRQIVDKQKKGDDGKYHNTGETRQQNAIDKAFDPENSRTVTEYKQKIEEPLFLETWLKANQGKDRELAKGLKGGGGAGKTGSGRPGGATKSASSSLFG